MYKILVTGGTGFIGIPLVCKLRQMKIPVISLGSKDGDIATIDLNERLKGEQITHVIHLAGRTFVPESWNSPVEFYKANVLGTANIADYCYKSKASLTYLSAYVYGIPEILPVHEESIIKPNNPYAHSKFLGENVCLKFAELFAVPTTILRPFNVYGCGQSNTFLIPKIINQVLNNDEIILDDLSPRRDYIYIADLVDAIVVSLRSQRKAAIYNIGSGDSISVQEVVKIIQRHAGTQKSVETRNIVRANEIQDVYADISKFKNDFGWAPKVSFSEGIQEILKNYG